MPDRKEVIWTVVPPYGTAGQPMVTRIDLEEFARTGGAVPQESKDLLDKKGAVGICTSATGEVLIVITDEGAALLDPDAVSRLQQQALDLARNAGLFPGFDVLPDGTLVNTSSSEDVLYRMKQASYEDNV